MEHEGLHQKTVQFKTKATNEKTYVVQFVYEDFVLQTSHTNNKAAKMSCS